MTGPDSRELSPGELLDMIIADAKKKMAARIAAGELKPGDIVAIKRIPVAAEFKGMRDGKAVIWVPEDSASGTPAGEQTVPVDQLFDPNDLKRD